MSVVQEILFMCCTGSTVCVLCRRYCLQACDVEEPEVRFNVDQYSDVVMIAKPVIYISVGEIVDTHSVS